LNQEKFLPLSDDLQGRGSVEIANKSKTKSYLSLKDILTSIKLQEAHQYISKRQDSDSEGAALKVSVSKQKFIFDNKECLMVIIDDLTTAENLERERQKNESL
jgi:hypothetical protein